MATGIDLETDGDDPWLLGPASPGPAEQPLARYGMQVDVLDPVTPLDAQIGAEVKKTVPDGLRDILFADHPPTPAELRFFGPDAAALPLRTYAVLDAARMPYLLTSLLERSKRPHQSLFQGDAAGELVEYAPYLVELDVECELTRRLFTGPDGIHGLWRDELGIFLRSRESLAHLRSHLRKFTRIKRENGD